jgi:hypothetical protein
MTRRTIILGLAGSLVSLPLSLGTHTFLSDPEEVAQQLTEWSLEGDLEKLIELYDPEDVVAFQQVMLATGDLYARFGELPPLADAGLDQAQARALDPPRFMRKALDRMYERIRRARKEYTIDMTAEVSEQSAAAAVVTVRTQVRLTPAQAEELGSFASLVQMPNERVYRMRRARGRWYVRFDENMHSGVARAQGQIDEFEARARRDRPIPDEAADPERFKRVGYRDEHARTVIEPRFADGHGFSEGLAAVEIDGLWGFIDPGGHFVIPPRFTEAGSFESGLAPVRNKEKLWGYVDRHGGMAIEPRFHGARDFSEGLAAVEIDDLWGYIDPSGAVAILPRYAHADLFCNGRAEVTLDDGTEIVVDRAGATLPDAEPLAPSDRLKGTPISTDNDSASTLEDFRIYGYRDAAGRTVIEPRFPFACVFHEGLAAVRFFYRWGFIDRTGRTVVAPHYQRAENFSEGLAGVQTIHELWGFVDRTGRLAIPARFDRVRAFHEGLAAVRHEDLWGFINPSGTIVIPFQFADAEDFSDGQAEVTLRPDRRSVRIDRTGRILPEREEDGCGRTRPLLGGRRRDGVGRVGVERRARNIGSRPEGKKAVTRHRTPRGSSS